MPGIKPATCGKIRKVAFERLCRGTRAQRRTQMLSRTFPELVLLTATYLPAVHTVTAVQLAAFAVAENVSGGQLSQVRSAFSHAPEFMNATGSEQCKYLKGYD